ncbi:hypothetical protein [Chitinophaga ginsengisoli]|uniref:Endosialidase-like protein n=1 Tax=Chitinophaga ginsengisoli TaxID=363837 RepID=A0A2P8FRR5_9BACT|nr:hypothetical protein [Chitinophaga ginsengisoli]PSL24420.1 hypothetical protein CLV42_1156 [Chitinophaga ginsengisoli]
MKKNLLLAALTLSAGLAFAQNTFPTSGNAGVNTTTPAYNLDVNGTFNANSISLGKQLVLPQVPSTPERGIFNLILPALRSGKRLHSDEQFNNGTNSCVLYNNAGNGNVTLNRVAVTGAPNTSGYCLEITHTGAAAPGLGGYYQPAMSGANKTLVQLFRAKIPVGYTLNFASNLLGTGFVRQWLTGNTGTGKWEDYAIMIVCGYTGTFSTGGYVFLTGDTPTVSTPLVWQVASSAVYDLSDLKDNTIQNQQTTDQLADLRITGNGYMGGNVGIGTADTKGYKLAVNGNAVFNKAVVKLYGNWPDYVFSKGYELPSLTTLKEYIDKEQHLPHLPAANQVEASGIDLAENQRALVKTVEELTLYIIQLKAEIDALKAQVQ